MLNNLKRNLLCAGLLLTSAAANAGLITSEVIFGSGNSNRGFTVELFGDLELALRAKQRYTQPNDQLGVGIIQDASGNYLFDSTGQSVPSNRAMWSFDWSINSDVTNGSAPLNSYFYFLGVDLDPTSAVNFLSYDPLSFGRYLGDNSTPNGGASESFGPGLLSQFNVAQNSVNYGFIPSAPLGAGEYRVELVAFDVDQVRVGSVGIDVFVDTKPIPEPGILAMMSLSLFGLVYLRRRRLSSW